MLRNLYRILGMTALLAVIMTPVAKALQVDEADPEYFDRLKIDRYLDVEIWTNHSDNEFYEGENVVLNFSVNRDAFVAIYSIDSRGRVNLLFPNSPGDDNFLQGGVTYQMPDGGDDFDLVVSGPDGVENVQIIASRERFPIPDWYPTSGLVCDWDDRLEYMDYVNGQYFIRYDGQRFAFDRTALYINEWEPEYYRPIYYPRYPSWTVCGNVYIDYPWGATVYINGIYWGVTPLYIPRIYVGWHTFTIYDYYGYCWEYPVHVTRYNTVILDRTVVVTSPAIVSKYKDVRLIGYRDPVTHGYPKFKTKPVITSGKPVAGGKIVTDGKAMKTLAKKYVRGSAKMVKGNRGYETIGTPGKPAIKGRSIGKGATTKSSKSTGLKGRTTSKPESSGSSSARYKSSGRSSTSGKSSSGSKAGKRSSSDKSSGYYQKKSGSSDYRKSTKSTKPSSGKTKIGKSSSGSKAKSSPGKNPSAGSKTSKPNKSSTSSGTKSSTPKKQSSSTKKTTDGGKKKK